MKKPRSASPRTSRKVKPAKVIERPSGVVYIYTGKAPNLDEEPWSVLGMRLLMWSMDEGLAHSQKLVHGIQCDGVTNCRVVDCHSLLEAIGLFEKYVR